MAYDPLKHHRRSTRLPGYDYSQPGVYFVTVCAHHKRPVFAILDEDGLRSNPYGSLVREAWLCLPQRFGHAQIEEFVVMPDHFHGLLRLKDEGAEQREPLGRIMAYFKYTTTCAINQRRAAQFGAAPAQVWQRNFYEHIVRNETDYAQTRRYILENPLHIHDDS